MKRSILLTLSILLAAPAALCQDIQVSATTDRDTVGVHDQFRLMITVSGKDAGDAENPAIPDLQGLKVVSGPSIGTQFQWINGRSTSSKSFTYILIPEKEGQFTIKPFDVRVEGKTYRTQAIQIRVTSAPPDPAPQRRNPVDPWDPFVENVTPVRRPLGDAVFMKAELDRSSAYPGQQVTLFYNLYTSTGITGIQLEENPPLAGFWVEDLEVEKTPKGANRMINGREYLVYTIKKQALFPNTSGKLKIPSSTFAISAQNERDMMSIFNRAETLYRNTEELTLDVKPLPSEGRPENFGNAVGKFSLSASIDKGRVETGEAVSLQVRLKGQGNIKTVPDIPAPELPDFTIYSSKREDKVETFEKNRIGGEKIWEYAIVPKAPGQQTIPSFSFSFFNEDRNAYETVATQPISLTVARGDADNASAAGPFNIDKQALTRIGTDIHFIRLSPGSFDKKNSPFYKSAWICLAIAFPLLFNAGALLYRRQRSKLDKDPGAVKSRKARQNALKRLKLAEQEGKADARRFYDLAASAFSGYLSDKFDLTGIELTGDNLERTLSMRNVPGGLIEEALACIQECDFGRFVSAAASGDRTSALSARLRKIIDELEKAVPAG